MRRIALVLLIAAILPFAAPDRGAAVGPDDGVWQVQQSNPIFSTLTFFASIHQNDAFLSSGVNVVFAVLSGNGMGTYGLGVRTGDAIQGTLYQPNGVLYGTFNVTVAGGTLNGSTFIQGYVFTLSGQKVF